MFKQRLQSLWPRLAGTPIEPHADTLIKITNQVIDNINQGDLSRWLTAHEGLPDVETVNWVKNQAAITAEMHLTSAEAQQLLQSLKGLHPWRKGPFQMADTFVDAEWRSNMKWERLLPGLPDLHNRTILDVGCGNGYYLFRMAEHQPRLALGIEPGLLHNVQFWSVEKYIQSQAAVLPLKIQDMPLEMSCFDVVFSMGVLYHRKSPIAHIEHLKSLLSPNGHLVLETLVVEGDEQTCLVPVGRYAQMRNVWFLPSVSQLSLWLRKIGFKNIQVVDESWTTVAEQRSTEWMRFHSLPQFLSDDQQQTAEGLPPPRRAIMVAQK